MWKIGTFNNSQRERDGLTLRRMRLTNLCLLVFALIPSTAHAQVSAGVPVIKILKEDSSIKFDVKASVAIDGTFDKWDSTIAMTSPDVETGVLDIKIQADSVNTGSGMKDGKLKGKDFFDAEHDPFITSFCDLRRKHAHCSYDTPQDFDHNPATERAKRISRLFEIFLGNDCNGVCPDFGRLG